MVGGPSPVGPGLVGPGLVGTAERWQWSGSDVLVGERQQRNSESGHRAELRSPEAGAEYDDLGVDGPPRGLDTAHLATGVADAHDLVPLQEPGAARDRPPCLRLGGPGGLGQSVGGYVHAAVDPGGVEQACATSRIPPVRQAGRPHPTTWRSRPCGRGRPSAAVSWPPRVRRPGGSRGRRPTRARSTSGPCNARTLSSSSTGWSGTPVPARARSSHRS